MDVLPLILLLLAVFVVARLVQMALDPGARQNPGAARSGSSRLRSRGPQTAP